MKRAGHLIEKIADLDNLHLAYYKAQKGKADKREVMVYGKNLQAHLRNLQEQILSGEVEAGGYRYFTIYDPKQRLICAAPFGQRVLHHALMNVCHPFFEQAQIFDSYTDKGLVCNPSRGCHSEGNLLRAGETARLEVVPGAEKDSY